MSASSSAEAQQGRRRQGFRCAANAFDEHLPMHVQHLGGLRPYTQHRPRGAQQGARAQPPRMQSDQRVRGRDAMGPVLVVVRGMRLRDAHEQPDNQDARAKSGRSMQAHGRVIGYEASIGRPRNAADHYDARHRFNDTPPLAFGAGQRRVAGHAGRDDLRCHRHRARCGRSSTCTGAWSRPLNFTMTMTMTSAPDPAIPWPPECRPAGLADMPACQGPDLMA